MRAEVIVAVMITLLVVTHEAVSRSPPVPTLTTCEYEGKMYPEGDFQPHPCMHCHCRGGQYHCAMRMCAPGPCADAITDSEHCCPYCPNGPNCHGPDGSVVQDGEEMQVGSKTCKCDTSSGLPLIACNFTD